MGSESASSRQYVAGKQGPSGSVAGAGGGTPGKRTLTEQLVAMAEVSVESIKPYAGATIHDGGGYTFRVLGAGTFEVTGTPPGREVSLHKVIAPSANAYAWQLLAQRLLSDPPPMPAAPATPAAAPGVAPAPVQAPPDPSLIQRAMRTVEAEFDEMRSGVNTLWGRAKGLLDTDSKAPVGPTGSDGHPAPQGAKPVADAAKPALEGATPAGAARAADAAKPAADVARPAAPTGPAPAPAPASRATGGERSVDNRDAPADVAEGVARFRTRTPTVGGDTLDIAKSRADLGVGGTEYTLNGLPHGDALRLKDIPALLAKDDAAQKKRARSKDPTATFDGELTEDERKKLTSELADLQAASKEAQRTLAAELASGKADQARFYCSGLSLWTLAAAGYDLGTRLIAPDGQPYRGQVLTAEPVPVNAEGKPVKKGQKSVGDARAVLDTKYVTLKLLVDGDPDAIEIMTRAKATGSSTVELLHTGYQTGDANGLALAARGGAGAFELAGIGSEVPELAQKPGDFAQSRRTTVGAGKDTELKHRGAGHAWQVTEVQVTGSAQFGKDLPRAPRPVTGTLEGWHDNVAYRIDASTDPALVGAHTVSAAKRIEAQNEGVITDEKADTAGDGGVQVTGWKSAPDAGLKSYTGYVVFYGRLGTSPWHNWTAATRASAQAAATAQPPSPASSPTSAAAAAP